MTIEKKSLFRDRSRIVKISICLFVGFIVTILFWNAYRLYYSSSTKGRTDRLLAIPEIPTELTDILKELNVHSDIKYLIKRSGISSLRLHLEFELSPNNFVDFFSDGLEYR